MQQYRIKIDLSGRGRSYIPFSAVCIGHHTPRVFHDSDDGMWQFLDSSEDITENDAVIVGLKEIVDLDKTINELHTLPLGWSAYRDDKNSNWITYKY